MWSFEFLEPEVGVAEAGAGGAVHVVAAPAEVAEGDLLAAEARRQGQLPPAGQLLALDEGVAEQDDAVAVLQGELLGGGGEGGQEEDEHQGEDAHGRSPRVAGGLDEL